MGLKRPKAQGVLSVALVVAAIVCAGAPRGAEAQTSSADGSERGQRVAEALDRQAPEPEWGIGLRLRYVAIPQFLLEQFWEEVASGSGNPGIGIDAVRRRGDFEFSFGFEYESLAGDSGGFWLEKGDDGVTPGQRPDEVRFDGFGWITLDAAFVFHKPLHEKFSLRYGGGFGLGIILGDVLQTDAVCTGRNINDPGVCMVDPSAAQVNDPADVPPVFPVINVLGGAQFRPMPQLLINVEIGLRTAPYMGIGTQYLF